MPTFAKCQNAEGGAEVMKTAKNLIASTPEHSLLQKVAIDFVFAYGNRDDEGNLVGDAITVRGQRALGTCRKVNLRDRAKGNGDAEIVIDADYWEGAPDEERRSLLDHELTHIQVLTNKKGAIKTDDLDRPQLKMRKHDVEVGWFVSVAKRHAAHSQERIQARKILDAHGQYLWPELVSINKGGRGAKLEVHEVNA